MYICCVLSLDLLYVVFVYYCSSFLVISSRDVYIMCKLIVYCPLYIGTSLVSFLKDVHTSTNHDVVPCRNICYTCIICSLTM